MNRIKVGFWSGTMVALVGFLLRLFAKPLARESLGPNASSIDSARHEMWQEISLVVLIFGLTLIAITLNRWLQHDPPEKS